MIWTTRPRSDFGRLAAIDAGAGPLLVLLHGVGLRAEAWAPVIDALSNRFRVIAPDMPGHGDSPFDSSVSTLSDYVSAVLRGLDGPAIVAGHSMGAMISLALAERAPDRVRSVLALSAIFKRDAAAATAVQARAAALDGVTAPDPTATLDRWFEGETSDAREACRTWLTTGDPRGYKAAYSVFANEDGPSRAALAAMSMPVCYMTGAKDPNSTPEMSRSMARLTPMGQADVVSRAAHMLPMTHPETVITALARLASKERM